MENKKFDPYSYLFPLGVLSAVLGLMLWWGFQLQWLSFFPRQAHANLMFFGFLWSFVSGFLMTAIPKMTQSRLATKFEISITVILVLTQWVLNLSAQIEAAYLIFVLQLCFLIYFVVRRFLIRKQVPFEGFIFLPFAFVVAFAGPLFLWLDPVSGVQKFYLLSGQAFVLNLICGLGGRLVPVLSRVPSALMPDLAGVHSKYFELGLFALTLNISFMLETMGASQSAYLLRGTWLVIYAIRHFKVLKRPTSRSFVGWGLRLATMLMVMGYLVLAMGITNILAGLHLVFIGGFSLLTLMVATRVTLAHGRGNLEPELNSKAIVGVGASLIVSALLRWGAGIDYTSLLLSFAVLAFVFAVLLWLRRFYIDLWHLG